MSESLQFKGTPGEWRVSATGFEEAFILRIINGERLDDFTVCYIPKGDNKEEDVMGEADAKLIACAPEMLSLLQWISKNTNSPAIGFACSILIKKALL